MPLIVLQPVKQNTMVGMCLGFTNTLMGIYSKGSSI